METIYNYTNVENSVIEKIKKCCAVNNHELIFTSHLSCHPDDAYLYIVLARSLSPMSLSKNYTIWEYNTGLFWGHYGLSFKDALKLYSEKINWYE